MSDHLLYDERDGVATITLNRPERLNALSRALSDDFVAAIERIRLSDDVKVLVIRGAGGQFCVGDDITEFPDLGNANQAMRRARFYQNMANQLEELDKVTVSAVDGYAIGGGLEITMAVRLRRGDRAVALGHARGRRRHHAGLGRHDAHGAAHRPPDDQGDQPPRRDPSRRSAPSKLGLWNRVVPDDQLEEASSAREAAATKHHQGLRQLKFIINKGAEADLYTAQGFEAMSVGTHRGR